MKNKKAILMKEFLGILIAVICLVLLVMFAGKLYGIFIKKTPADQAKETLNQIVAKIDSLDEGENSSYMVVSPINWVLMSNGEKLCICSFEDKDFDFFKSSRNVAFWTCAEEGFCENIKNNINPEVRCSYDLFQSCLEFKNLPLQIYIEKKEIIHLMTKKGSVIGNIFERALDYKKDEDSKTMRELILELMEIKTRIDDAGFFETMVGSGPVQESIEKQAEISEVFEDYLNLVDTKKEFNCEREKLAWKITMYKLNEEGEPEGKWTPVASSEYLTFSRSIASISLDIKEYRLKLRMWEGR